MESQVTLHWGVLGFTFALATVSIGLRLGSRYLTRAKFWWDDAFAILGYIVDVVWFICLAVWLRNGLGQHIENVKDAGSIEDILRINKLFLFIIELFYAYGLFFGKVSILAFYWRMFGISNIKIPIQVLLGCSVIWIVIRTFMGTFQCTPVQAFWDSNAGGYCVIDSSKFFFGTTLVHALIDMAILTLPVIQIMKLNLPLMQKIAVTFMFLFGLFICIAAIALIVKAVSFDGAALDFTWNISEIILWAGVEVNLTTVSACLPTFRPALNFIFRHKLPGSSAGANSGTYGTYGGNSHAHSRRGRSTKNMTAIVSQADDEGSTYQLAETNRADRSASREGYEDAYRRFGVNVTAIPGDPESQKHGGSGHGEDGIHVRNETVISVSTVRPDSDEDKRHGGRSGPHGLKKSDSP
ncbi:unnamed protein product [Clonostachys rosea f. rosea IK726]|uniref:Rhodopsin domain-containing protein n=2 Tax=Bionectria ochroleuca TaxID=29856 RepID=A0A0B7JWK4_BIOOC|nr:unnamed protein product [Clonostachys rosea f. rosea IK726]